MWYNMYMRKTFKYRIYANQTTLKSAENWLHLCRTLYNLALELRIFAYRNYRKYVSQHDQSKQLPALKEAFPEFAIVNAQTLQDVLERLEKAYVAFFRRVKQKRVKTGFPRFKGAQRYDSFALKQNGWRLENDKLIIKNIGIFKLKLSRPIEGNIKTVTIKRNTRQWYVLFSCENVPLRILPKTNRAVGIDVGCESFLTDSNGKKIANPRFLNNSEQLLKEYQRILSRKKLRFVRRKKTKILFAKLHRKISRQRRDFHFKIALQLVRNFDTICIEKLSSFKSFRSLNRSMRDVAWCGFFTILLFKAEEAGKEVMKIPAENTSQRCSNCDMIVPKVLNDRIHDCQCGFRTDRDHNAALNILKLGLNCQKDHSSENLAN